MKVSLVIEALTSPRGEILQRVSAALRLMPELPETLVWSMMPGELDVRIWIVLSAEPPQIDTLADELRKVPGVGKVILDESPTEAPIEIPAAKTTNVRQ